MFLVETYLVQIDRLSFVCTECTTTNVPRKDVRRRVFYLLKQNMLKRKTH